MVCTEPGKSLVVHTSDAAAVAYPGPKRRWPPIFYLSSMLMADADALATDSFIFACMASFFTERARFCQH
jgi:hypothetical protein